MKENKQNHFSRTRRSERRLLAGAVLIVSLLSACSGNETRHNEKPLLASNWGGSGGGPIRGRLEVLVFDDATHFPFPGAVVSLGDSGTVTATTDRHGIALFEGVQGPQDVHVFGCSGCGDDSQFPLPYQATSLYRVNAAYLAVPLFTRDPALSDGKIEGKVFDVNESETVYLAAIDEIGGFKISDALGSTTRHLFNDESPVASQMTFVFSKNLDDWAAGDAAAGRQEFNTVALYGTALNPAGKPQGGVRLEARYFNGNPAGRAYYFNESGAVDPALDGTSADGRFVFLRLSPNNDLFVSATSLGTGIGARPIHLPQKGTVLFSLPVLPLTNPLVDLSGRIVQYRLDFREEEKKGPFVGRNVGIEGALISLSGDRFDQAIVADRGPGINGNYRIERHLLPNGRYVAVVLSGRGFRPTYQEIATGSRSKLTDPLTAVLLSDLVAVLRDAEIPDTPDENGQPRFRVGLLPGHGEILGRVVETTGETDANGDPIVRPVKEVTLAVTDEAGNEAKKRDPAGQKVNNLFYLEPNGTINPDAPLAKTSEGGGFAVFDLPGGGSSVYTLVAKNAAGEEIARRAFPVYADSARLIELEITPKKVRPAPKVVDVQGNPISGVSFSLIGGGLKCAESCASNPEGETTVALPPTGEFLIAADRKTGGGDYSIPFQGSKRRLGVSAFRITRNGLDNVTFSGGLGPLSPGRRLLLEIGFKEPPALATSSGRLSLPPFFGENDFRVAMIGAVGPQGRAFVGIDPALLFGPLTGYRALSLPTEQALSYFVFGFAQNQKGEFSRVFAQGFQIIPALHDLSFRSPPASLSPNGETGVTRTPRLSWSPPADGAPDFYRMVIRTETDQRLWTTLVPPETGEITLPNVPAEVPEPAAPLKIGARVKWGVSAIHAPGLTLHQFTYKELGDRLAGDAQATAEFVP